MTGFYLKEKRHAGGDFKSEEDIRKIHWKTSPLAIFFFHFQEQFCTFPSEGKVCSAGRGAGGREGCHFFFFFFCVGLKCRGRNENQLAGRHYLSILVQECIDMERKNRPSPNPVKPAPPPLPFLSLYFIFSIWPFSKESWCSHKTRDLQTGWWCELMYSCAEGIHFFVETGLLTTKYQLNVTHVFSQHQEQIIFLLSEWTSTNPPQNSHVLSFQKWIFYFALKY